MTPRPIVVLLAGRSGVGKSTFAPYLAHHLGAAVFDSDTLFEVPRRVVGDANGLGMAVVSNPLWRESVHPRLLDLLLALAACTATAERPAVAVSPWTAMLCSPERFAAATDGMEVDWRWVMLQGVPRSAGLVSRHAGGRWITPSSLTGTPTTGPAGRFACPRAPMSPTHRPSRPGPRLAPRLPSGSTALPMGSTYQDQR